MASTYLTTDGDINQAKRKRAGESMAIDAVPKQTSFDITNTPTPGNPGRAAQMQAQFDQPVTKVTQTGGSGGGGIGGAVERVKGAYSAVSPLINPVGTAVDALTAAPADALRNSVIRAAGGDPATAEGGETANTDRAFGNLMPAVNLAGSIADTVSRGVKGGVLAATGASPAPQAQALPSIAAPVQPAPTQGRVSQQPGQQASQAAESPYFATGSGIAVRRNDSGVTEFSNDPAAVSGAQTIPAGGIGGQPLRTPGVSNMADDVALEKRGSINNVGNGVGGGLSVGAPGDAALALGRFERANQEREKMIQVSRRGGIGEGGGRVTVVRDSSREPSIAELMNARMQSRQVQDETARTQAQQSIMEGADQLATNQLTRQKTQQELDAGQVGLESQQRLAKLGAMMADPNLGTDQRQAARDAYTSLSTPAKDRFKSQDFILGRDENGRDIRGTQLIDVTTGRPVTGGIGDVMPQRSTTPTVGSRQGGYEFIGGDPADKNSWRKV